MAVKRTKKSGLFTGPDFYNYVISKLLYFIIAKTQLSKIAVKIEKKPIVFAINILHIY